MVKAKIRTDWPTRQLLELKGGQGRLDELERRDIGRIIQELQRPSEIEMGVCSGCFKFLGTYLGERAIHSLWEAESDHGWSLLAQSLEYLLASFKIRHAIGFPNGTPIDTDNAGKLLATAIALQSKPVATWVADVLLTSYQAPPRKHQRHERQVLKGWTETGLAPLALFLAGCIHADRAVKPEPAEKFGDIYEALLAAEDLESTQAALDEFVINRALLTCEVYNPYPPFEWAPFNLFPVDALAILMVKYSSIHRFNFGGMESPLCDPPLPFPFERMPLVDQVLARVAEAQSVADVQWG